MKFTTVASLLAIVGSAVAQWVPPTAGFDPILSPSKEYQEVEVGTSFQIEWDATAMATYTDSPVSIYLLYGETPATLSVSEQPIAQVVNSVGKATWTVPSPEYKVYGFKISVDNTDPEIYQYSFPITLVGGEKEDTTSSTAVSATSVTSDVLTKETISVATEYSAAPSASIPCPPVNSTTVSVDGSSPYTTGGYTKPTLSTQFNPVASATSSSEPVFQAAGIRTSAGSLTVLGGVALAVAALL